jgi:exosortase/archaeosortase family protein
MIRHSPTGVPYLPDGTVAAPPAAVDRPQPVWRALLVFFVAFGLLQWGWGLARDSWIERLVIHEATVKPAAALVRLLTPEVPARGVGPSIKAPGGGLNILNGCEGTEVMFLLMAAFAAVRLSWRRRVWGLALGLALVFALNQARVLALFYAFRTDRSLFDILHTTILPVALVALSLVYFHAVLSLERKRLA